MPGPFCPKKIKRQSKASKLLNWLSIAISCVFDFKHDSPSSSPLTPLIPRVIIIFNSNKAGLQQLSSPNGHHSPRARWAVCIDLLCAQWTKQRWTICQTQLMWPDDEDIISLHQKTMEAALPGEPLLKLWPSYGALIPLLCSVPSDRLYCQWLDNMFAKYALLGFHSSCFVSSFRLVIYVDKQWRKREYGDHTDRPWSGFPLTFTLGMLRRLWRIVELFIFLWVFPELSLLSSLLLH